MARHAVAASKSSRAEGDARLAAMAKVAGKSAAFRPARQVLKRVRAVPTIFPGSDNMMRVGGWPIDRVVTLHGPSGHGKTQFAVGIGLSFLQRAHFFKFIDAERTTPITWIEKLFADFTDHVGFSAMKPKTYEDAVAEVRTWSNAIGDGKAKNVLPSDMTGVVVVDSIGKLTPRGFFDKIARAIAEEDGEKKGRRPNTKTVKIQGGTDGFGGRAGQIKAALHKGWLDELVPLMDDTGTAIVLITRESVDVEADFIARAQGRDWKVQGGKSVIYDASILARVEQFGWVYGPGPDDKKKPVFGERHRVSVTKTKIAGKEGKTQVGYFHSANGMLQGVPEGFDRARDVVTLGKSMGVVKASSSWLTWGKNRWNGENSATRALTAKPELLEQLEVVVRAKFDKDCPDEVDADGVVT